MDTPTLDFEEITLAAEIETTIDFAVKVPLHSDHTLGQDSSLDGSLARPTPKANSDDNPAETAFIVGTILRLGASSANIWIGWGEASEEDVGEPKKQTKNGKRRMGSFVVAMPRRQYAGGAFGNDFNSSSKLIGSGSVQNDLVAINMASRLSEKLKMAIFCSCNLDEGRPEAALGGETEMYMLQSRAASLAEKEIGQILQSS